MKLTMVSVSFCEYRVTAFMFLPEDRMWISQETIDRMFAERGIYLRRGDTYAIG